VGDEPLKSISKIWISSFVNPSKIFVWEAYIHSGRMDRLGVVAMSLAQCDAHCSFEAQTKILEGGTKDEIRISKEALFHDSWPKLSTHALRKYSKSSISSFVPPSKIFVWEG
jgi:hypothetical protein